MNDFLAQLNARIAKYDLLTHPFYQAWSAGELSRDDLQGYARDYYHHVNAFPGYLEVFASRLHAGRMKKAVLANMAEENGAGSERPHSEIWLDFAEGVDAGRETSASQPVAEITRLIEHFQRIARQGSEAEALAAFYAYESQVPRVAQEKAQWLRKNYSADDFTCGYFDLHATADVHHAQVWCKQLESCLAENPTMENEALEAGEAAARVLWQALDGIERRRAGNQRMH